MSDTDQSPAPWDFSGNPRSWVLATALHSGHDVRREVSDLLAIDDESRLREEDPHTDHLTTCSDFRLVVSRSRFEVDLNRSRDEAVYRDDAWGLEVWKDDPGPELIARSLDLHDTFYADMATLLDRMAADGPFLVLDIHSYNHRRAGPDAPAAADSANPDVNVGTGSMPHRWRPVVYTMMHALRQTEVNGHRLDVRENVRFRGGHFAQWVHEHYPTRGCALALEFKKTFMDEWTGELDRAHLDALTEGLRDATPSTAEALRSAA